MYNPARLKEMAQIVTESAPDKQFEIIMRVAEQTGMSPNEVRARIQELADA